MTTKGKVCPKRDKLLSLTTAEVLLLSLLERLMEMERGIRNALLQFGKVSDKFSLHAKELFRTFLCRFPLECKDGKSICLYFIAVLLDFAWLPMYRADLSTVANCHQSS